MIQREIVVIPCFSAIQREHKLIWCADCLINGTRHSFMPTVDGKLVDIGTTWPAYYDFFAIYEGDNAIQRSTQVLDCFRIDMCPR